MLIYVLYSLRKYTDKNNWVMSIVEEDFKIGNLAIVMRKNNTVFYICKIKIIYMNGKLSI